MKILFIDSTCVICDGFACWLLKRLKPSSLLHVSSLDSPVLLEYVESDVGEARDAVVLLMEGELVYGAKAVTRLNSEMKPLWGFLFRMVGIFPERLREGIYDWVAKNRKKIFGSQDFCSLKLTQDSRFI